MHDILQKVREKVGSFAKSVLLCTAKHQNRHHATSERILLFLLLLYPDKVKREVAYQLEIAKLKD
jgi:hypothetical protein